MIKKIVIIVGVVCAPLRLNGMELLNLGKKKDNSTVSKSSQKIGTDSTNGSIAKLNLDNLSDQLPISKTGKSSIKSLEHVHHLRRTQSTYRDKTTSRDKSRRSPVTSSDVTINIDDKIDFPQNSINIDKQDIHGSQFLKKIDENDIGDGMEQSRISTSSPVTRRKNTVLQHDLNDESSYASQHMWDLLKKANPAFYQYAQQNDLSLDEVMDCPYNFEGNLNTRLYSFAKKHQMPLEEIMEMSHLLENFDIEPQAMVEWLKDHHQLKDNVSLDWLVKKFEDIQKNKPDKYIDMVLDFVRKTVFEMEEKDVSPLNKVHVALQHKEISSQRSQIYLQWAGIIAAAITTIGGAAWGIYGQATGTNTLAPTHAPTNMPTYMPTGAPI